MRRKMNGLKSMLIAAGLLAHVVAQAQQFSRTNLDLYNLLAMTTPMLAESDPYFSSGGPARFSVRTLGVNSPLSEHSPTFFGNQVVFATNKNLPVQKGDPTSIYGAPIADLFVADQRDNALVNLKPFPFNSDINFRNEMVVYSANGKTRAVVRRPFNLSAKEQRQMPIIRSGIYVTRKEVTGNWMKEIPFPYNSNTYSCTHPTISPDGVRLFFASDMPGSVGGMDLWYSDRQEDGTWSKPVNMGFGINTSGNEVTPFFAFDSLMYFASDGHRGLGGLDMFVTRVNGNTFSAPQNLGEAINSKKNDFGLIMNPSLKSGYFVSNRMGGIGEEDIYGFDLLIPFDRGDRIKVFVVDNIVKTPIISAEVAVINEKGEVIRTGTMNDDGSITVQLLSGEKGQLRARKKGYKDDLMRFNATDILASNFSPEVKMELEKELTPEEIAQREAKRQAEIAEREAKRQAELARIEAEKKAEAARIEAEKKAELARVEAERKAEEARLEVIRKEELAKAEAAKKAELARAEEARKAELAKAEAERKAALAKAEEERKAEAAKQAELAKAETIRKAEAIKAENARLAELAKAESARKIELAKAEQAKAEEARKAEAAKQAELAKVEAEKKAEIAKADAAKKAELAKAEEAKKAELAKADAAKKEEAAKQAELAKADAAKNAEVAKAEEAKKAELAKAEAAKKEELAKADATKKEELAKAEENKKAELAKAEAAKKEELAKADANKKEDVAKADATKKAELAKAEETKKAELAKVEAAKKEEVAKADAAKKAELAKAEETKKAEIAKADAAKKEELAKADAAKKSELTKAEEAKKAELAKADASKKEELAKADATKKAELAKAEEAKKAELAKAEATKKEELAKADAAKKAEIAKAEAERKEELAQIETAKKEELAKAETKKVDKTETIITSGTENKGTTKTNTAKSTETVAMNEEGPIENAPKAKGTNAPGFEMKSATVNSAAAESTPAFFGNQLVYSKLNPTTGASEMYVADMQNGTISNEQPFKIPGISTGKESSVSLSPDGYTMIFARTTEEKVNTANGPKMVKKSGLYFSTKQANGEWGVGRPFSFNNGKYNIEQPVFAADGKRVYYVSNMPGSRGKSDIWYSEITPDGSWSAPINAGPNVNTTGKESSPFIAKDGSLFFASEGHDGLGGMDVFVAANNTKGFAAPVNLGPGINSAKNDQDFVLSADETKAYMISNRAGGAGKEDLYAVNVLAPIEKNNSIKGIVRDRDAGKPIPARVALIDEKGSIVQRADANQDGYFNIPVKSVEVGQLRVTSNGYIDKYVPVNVGKIMRQKDAVPLQIALETFAVTVFKATIKDGLSGPLSGATVKLIDNKSKTTIFETVTDANGTFSQEVKKTFSDETIDAVLVIQKEGYLNRQFPLEDGYAVNGVSDLNDLADLRMSRLEVGADLAKMVNLSAIYFDLGKSAIRPDAAIELEKVVTILNDHPEMELELGAYTDCRGSVPTNLILSKKRAEETAKYLRSRISNPSRIVGVGHGETKSVNDCDCDNTPGCTEEEHQLNRRTEFIIKKLK